MKKISFILTFLFLFFLYDNGDLYGGHPDCKKVSKKRTKKYMITTSLYCKVQGGRYEKNIKYYVIKQHQFKERLRKNTKKREKLSLSFDKVKVEAFGYTFANGNKFKKSITNYKNGKRVKVEVFGYTYANSDKFKKGITNYKNGKKVKDELFDYYMKSENKTYDKVISKKKNGIKSYFHKGKLIKTRKN